MNSMDSVLLKSDLFSVLIVAASVLLLALFIVYGILVYFVNRRGRKIDHQLEKADRLSKEGKTGEAIRIWKGLMMVVGERQVLDILSRFEFIYDETENSKGLDRLIELKKMFVRFFEMSRHLKTLSEDENEQRKELANRIVAMVAALPAENI